LALMQGQQLSIDATKAALNSYGSAVRENEKYLQSLEARINMMKNAWTELGLAMGDALLTDSIIVLTEFAKGLANQLKGLVDNFGVLPVVLGTAGFAAGALSKNFRTLTIASISLGKGITALGVSARAATAALRGLASATVVGAVFVALGYGLELLINYLAEANNEIEQFEDRLEDLNFQSTGLEQLIKEYEGLLNKTDKTIEDQQRMREIQRLFVSEYGVAIEAVNEYGEAYAENIELAKERLEILKEEVRLEKERAINAYKKEESEQIERLEKEQQAIEKYIKNIKKHEQSIREYQERISSGKVSSEYLQFAREEISRHQREIEKYQDKLAKSEENYKKTLNNIILNNYKAFEKIMDDLSEQGIKVNDKIRGIIHEWAKIWATEGKTIDQVSGTVRKLIIELTKLPEDASIDDLLNLFKKLNIKFIPDENIDSMKIFKIILSGMSNELQYVNTELDEMADQTDNATDSIKNYLSEIKELNAVLRDLNSNQTLNAETVFDLIIKYPQLINHIHKTTNGWKIEKEAIIALRAERINDQITAIQSQTQMSDAVIKELGKRLESYDIEISKIYDLKTAREELAKIDKPLLTSKPILMSDEAFLREEFEKKYGAPNINLFQKMAYDKAFEQFLQSEKRAYEEYIKLYNDTINYGKSEEERRKNAEELQKRLEQLRKELETPSFGDTESKSKKFDPYIIDEYANKISELELQLDQSETRQTRLNETSAEYRQELELQIELYRQMQNLTKDHIKSLENQNLTLSNQRKRLSQSSEEYHKLTEQIDKNNQKIIQLKSSIESWERSIISNEKELVNIAKQIEEELLDKQRKAEEEKRENAKRTYDIQKEAADLWKDYIENTADEIVDIYKKALEKQRDLAIDHIQEQIKLEDERHKKRIENLDDEYGRFEEIINAQLKSLDRTKDEEDYQKELTKKQQKQLELQKKIDELSLDNSIEAKARRAELQKELAELIEETEEFMRNRQIELRKEALQDTLDNKKKEIDNIKKSEDKIHETIKNRLEKQLEDEKKFWEELLKNDQFFMDLRQNIIDGKIENINTSIAGLKNQVESHMISIGQSIDDNFIKKLQQAQSMLESIDYSNPAAPKPRDESQYYQPKNDFEKRIIELMKKNSEEWFFASDAQRKELERINEQYAEFLGGNIYKSKGVWYKDGLRLYHEGGVVGDPSKFSLAQKLHKLLNLKNNEELSILKHGELVLKNPIDSLSKMLSSFNLANLINQRTGEGNRINNINIYIDKVTGDRKSAEDVASTIVKRLTARGVVLNN